MSILGTASVSPAFPRTAQELGVSQEQVWPDHGIHASWHSAHGRLWGPLRPVEQESQSGDVSLGYSVTNSGDYASQCAPAIQFGNTGNFQNAPSFLQYGSEADDFEPGGIEVTFAPQQGVDCSNEIQQSSAASSYGGGYYYGGGY